MLRWLLRLWRRCWRALHCCWGRSWRVRRLFGCGNGAFDGVTSHCSGFKVKTGGVRAIRGLLCQIVWRWYRFFWFG
jgi:hypothetical protein